MKIALLSTGHPVYDAYPNGGGIQHQILGLATEMARHKHDVHIICRSVDETDSRVRKVAFHALDGILRDGVLSALSFSRKAASMIARLEPDVVSTFERFSAYFPSLLDLPMTFTTENYDAFRYYRRFSIGYNPLNALVFPWKRRLEEGVMKRSQLVVALTESIQGYLASIGIRHTRIIPNGVASDDYSNLGDEGYVLYAGRLDAPKRVDLLIRSFARLVGSRDGAHLLIVGRGPERSNLIRLSHEHGIASRVQFEDWVPRNRLRQLLGRCTVFVLPSAYEALPVVLLEAMACSKAVIAMDVPGPRDVLVNGVNGVLVETNEMGELAESLGRCLEDDSLRRALGASARETVTREYDFRHLGNRLLKAYDGVFSGRSGPA